MYFIKVKIRLCFYSYTYCGEYSRICSKIFGAKRVFGARLHSLALFYFQEKSMTLKFFSFNFFENLCNSIISLIKNLWEIICLIIVFMFVWGIVCIAALIFYALFILVCKYMFKKDIGFLKYVHIVSISSAIIAIILLIFVL